MTVEDLMIKLKCLPPLYNVVAFQEGCEIEDWEAEIVTVEICVVTKTIQLHIHQRIKQIKQ